jgi:hypothetical protein
LGHASLATSFDLYDHLDTRDLAADLALITAEENHRSKPSLYSQKAPTGIEPVCEALQASA